MIKKGEKLHIVERRYFSGDIMRHFCGEVIAGNDFLLRLTGYVWILNTASNQFKRKVRKRERVFCLSDRITINIIHPDTVIDDVKYFYSDEEGHYVTDEKNFTLNISEFGIII